MSLDFVFVIAIESHNFNNIRNADDTVSIADTEKKTTRTPTEGGEEKPEERTKHQN